MVVDRNVFWQYRKPRVEDVWCMTKSHFMTATLWYTLKPPLKFTTGVSSPRYIRRTDLYRVMRPSNIIFRRPTTWDCRRGTTWVSKLNFEPRHFSIAWNMLLQFSYFIFWLSLLTGRFIFVYCFTLDTIDRTDNVVILCVS